MTNEGAPHEKGSDGLDELSLQDFMRTAANIAENGVFISGIDTPTTRSRQVPVGSAPIGEQIDYALEQGDYDTASALHEQNPEQPKVI